MLVIPAIDLKDGKCVRLRQGRAEDQTVYSDNPADTARRWETEGAEWLHVVDLDGAFNQRPQNVDAIRQILDHVNIPVQLGASSDTMYEVVSGLKEGDQVLARGNPSFTPSGARGGRGATRTIFSGGFGR